MLLGTAPHLVLDGAVYAADLIGAAEAVVAELRPEVITLDDWGYPIIHGDVPAGLRDEAAEAARLCPRLALRLTTETR